MIAAGSGECPPAERGGMDGPRGPLRGGSDPAPAARTDGSAGGEDAARRCPESCDRAGMDALDGIAMNDGGLALGPPSVERGGASKGPDAAGIERWLLAECDAGTSSSKPRSDDSANGSSSSPRESPPPEYALGPCALLVIAPPREKSRPLARSSSSQASPVCPVAPASGAPGSRRHAGHGAFGSIAGRWQDGQTVGIGAAR